MYGFLATRKWIAFGALMALLATIMVGLGLWQLSRYHQRSATNARITAAGKAAPVPLGQVLTAGRPVPAEAAWTRVSVRGRYDPQHEVLARGRTADGGVGFEVLTPLVLDDGTAVLVDRGWLAPAPDSVLLPSPVPAAPQGQVTVTGRLHLPESRADPPERVDGTIQVRRIAPARVAEAMPYRLFDGYVLLDSGAPGSGTALTPIPADYQNAVMNAGYVVQWWAFALITLGGFVWAARREAHGDEDIDLAWEGDLPADPDPAAADSPAAGSPAAEAGPPSPAPASPAM